MIVKPALTALAIMLATPAGAGWFGTLRGNDTGGIIPWSPAAELTAVQQAEAHCATYNKVAVMQSVHRVYGDYIGFVCAFPRDYDPVKAQAIWGSRPR